MSAEMVLTGARLVLDDAVVAGSLVIRDGRIAMVDAGASALAGAIDCEGDFLLPGLIDLHTDNLERQVEPRTHARWPARSAMLAHDAQCVAAGITTVCDALCLGDLGFDKDRVRTFRDGVAEGDALYRAGLLRADHRLHLRCEVPAEDMLDLFDTVARHPRLAMASLMDHTPGEGQYADLDRYRALRRAGGMAPAEIVRLIATLQANRARLAEPNRRALLERLAGRRIAVASHDDRTEAEVAANAADGITVSEFPVTAAAARAARRVGMRVIAGAPNLVRGGSHAGNVAVAELLAAGLADALASDYVPVSLLDATFHPGAGPLPAAVARVTSVPAALLGLADRGRIAPGLRADLARVRVFEGQPVVRAAFVAGERAG